MYFFSSKTRLITGFRTSCRYGMPTSWGQGAPHGVGLRARPRRAPELGAGGTCRKTLRARPRHAQGLSGGTSQLPLGVRGRAPATSSQIAAHCHLQPAKLRGRQTLEGGVPLRQLLGPSRPSPTHLHELLHGLGCQGVGTEKGVGVGWEGKRKCFLGLGGNDPPHPTHPRWRSGCFQPQGLRRPATSVPFTVPRPRVGKQSACGHTAQE